MKNKRIGIIPIIALLIFIMGTTSVFAATVTKPTFTNITGGATYATPFIPTWTVVAGASSTATLDGATYIQGTAITTQRSHTLIVTAKRTGYTSSSRSIQFYTEIPPTAPTIDNIINNHTYATAVSPTWTDASGTTSTATLDGSSYTEGTSIATDGSHTLIVTASKTYQGLTLTAPTTVTFTIAIPPVAPSITGVTAGTTYAAGVTPTWTDPVGTTSTATLDGSAYTKGTAVATDGTHVLAVTAKRTTTATTTVTFTIAIPPVAPVITGVTGGTTYVAPVTPNWTDATAPTTITATLDGSAYTEGTAIAADGTHVLAVTARRNTQSVTTTVTFTIAISPAAPVITGVTDGTTYAASVTPTWTDPTGTTSTAILDGSAYTKGTAVTTDGSHVLTVTAKKTVNGLTAVTTVDFKIDLENGDWAVKTGIALKNTPEADLMVRVGDIDNFGFGWTNTSATFDPFSGNSTVVHSFPWTTPSDELAGLDRIMVISGYKYGSTVYNPTTHQAVTPDGYTSSTSRTANAVTPVTLSYDLSGITVTNAILQLFVDDIQPGNAHGIANGFAHYQVTINGVRVPELETMINALDQSGPIGRMITLTVPSQYIDLIKTGSIAIKFDDPSGAPDGYAIDFVKLLINPLSLSNTGTVTGTVTESIRHLPLANVTISDSSTSTITDSSGKYTLRKVAAGQAQIKASIAGYEDQTLPVKVVANETSTLNFCLVSTDVPKIPHIYENPNTLTNQDVTVTIAVDDTPASIWYSINGKSTWTQYIDTNGFQVSTNLTVYAKSRGENGKESPIASLDITNIDKSIPPAPVFTQSPDASITTSGKVTVTVAYPSNAPAGAKGLEYSTNTGQTYQAYSGPFTVSSNTSLKARYKNIVNTQSLEGVWTVSNIRPAAPVLTEDITKPTQGPVSVTAVFPSGTVKHMYSIDGGATWSDYTAPISVSKNLTVLAKDNDVAGVWSLTTSLDIANIDNTKPVITLNGDNPFTLKFKAAFNDPGATVTDNMSKNLTATVDASALNNTKIGTYKVYYNATDEAGNKADTVTRTVEVIYGDGTAPSIILTPDITATTTHVVTVTANVTDDVSGVDYVKYASGDQSVSYFATAGTAMSSTFTVSVNGVYTVYAIDNAGNAAVKTITISNIQSFSNPNVKVTPKTGDTNKSVTITLANSSSFDLEYKLGSGGTWKAYSSPFKAAVGDTVITREVDDSVPTNVIYHNGGSRTIQDVLTAETPKSLKNGSSVRISVTVNSDDANSNSYVEFVSTKGTDITSGHGPIVITLVTRIDYNGYSVFTYQIKANKAGFNEALQLEITNVKTVHIPVKVQTISTNGVM